MKKEPKSPGLVIFLCLTLLLVPTTAIVNGSCMRMIPIHPIIPLLLFIMMYAAYLYKALNKKVIDTQSAKGFVRTAFSFVLIYNVFALAYSLLIYPYLFKNKLFWDAIGAYSGAACVPLLGAQRTSFIVEDFPTTYGLFIIPLSIGIIYFARKISERTSLQKASGVDIQDLLIFLLTFILTAGPLALIISMPVIQAKFLDRYQVLGKDGISHTAYYVKNYRNETFFFQDPPDSDENGFFYQQWRIVKEDLKDNLAWKVKSGNNKTFEVVSAEHYLAKDQNYVYSAGKILEGVNPKTFKNYAADYWGDEEQIFFGGLKLEGINVQNFEHMGYYWSRDENKLYFYDLKTEYHPNMIDEVISTHQIKMKGSQQTCSLYIAQNEDGSRKVKEFDCHR